VALFDICILKNEGRVPVEIDPNSSPR